MDDVSPSRSARPAAPPRRLVWIRSAVGPTETASSSLWNSWKRRGQLLFVLLLVIGLPIAVARAVRHGNSDLCGFCAAGRYVLEHGNRDPASALSRYWPSADIPWMALAYLPSWLAAAIWYPIGCGTWLGLLRTVFRVCRRRIPTRPCGHTSHPRRRLADHAAGG